MRTVAAAAPRVTVDVLTICTSCAETSRPLQSSRVCVISADVGAAKSCVRLTPATTRSSLGPAASPHPMIGGNRRTAHVWRNASADRGMSENIGSVGTHGLTLLRLSHHPGPHPGLRALCQTLVRGLADDLPLEHWLAHRIWRAFIARSPVGISISALRSVPRLLHPQQRRGAPRAA